MQIEVKDIKKVNGGKLKGFATVMIDGIVIHDFRIVQQDQQKAWVSPPQTIWKNDEGETKYKSIVEFSKELKQKIENAVLNKFEGGR